jgi:hypothetical protein
VDFRGGSLLPNAQGALCALPILAYPQPEGRYIVDTDASNIAIQGVLSQVHDRQERVIAYYSKTLNKAERNYCIIIFKLPVGLLYLTHNNIISIMMQPRKAYSYTLFSHNMFRP